MRPQSESLQLRAGQAKLPYMKILGIETSCDETAICLLEAKGQFGPEFEYAVLGNALISQAALHSEYGGVFPNLAKREHAKNLVPLLEKVLADAENSKSASKTAAISHFPADRIEMLLQREPELLERIIPFFEKHGRPEIDAIAVTAGPGLEPALWVGINFAKALSAAWDVPIVAVNHMEGHVILPMMDIVSPSFGKLRQFDFPVLALLISGGHTELVLSKQFQQHEIIGQTRDDAAGEAFDKVARLLGLPYPGGPEVSRLAKEAREKNTKGDFKFTRPMMHEDNFDFSFSGLKTAVRRVVEQNELTEELKLQIAREFEECVADVLVEKTIAASESFGADTVIVGGGVSANTYIRERLAERMMNASAGTRLLSTSPDLATDNALMIALSGYFRAIKNEFTEPGNLAANGNLSLD